MTYEFSTDFYSKIAVLKAAYSFTDRAFIFVDIIDGHYIIDVEAKNTAIKEDEFKNELLFQELRYQINRETKDLRNIIASRALASSTIGRLAIKETADFTKDNSILEDWFANDNKEV